MNRLRILAFFAGFALFFGLGQMVFAAQPTTTDHAFTVPAGAYYYHFDFHYLLAAPVALSYEVTSAGDVLVYVASDAQYLAYRSGQGLAFLASSDSNAGSLSLDLPSGGTFHVLVFHASGSESMTEDVSVTMHYSGIAPTGFLVGVGSLVLGVALYGVWWRLRAKRRALPQSPEEAADSMGVTFFEPPKPPAG